MNNFFSILLFFTVIACSKKDEFKKMDMIPSKIDSLKTNLDVEQFMRNVDSTLKYYKLKSPTDFVPSNRMDTVAIAIADSLKIDKPFYRLDLDNNGYSDLIVFTTTTWNENQFDSFTLLNYGSDSIRVVSTQPYRHTFTVPKIIYRGEEPIVEIHYPDILDWKTQKVEKINRLVTVKFGDYVEVNDNVENYTIEKIEFSTTPCYGTCPVFKMTINKDKSAIFKPQYYNLSESEKEEKQVLKTIIDNKSYNQIIKILNYINFPTLEKEYSVSWTDDQTSILKITYNNGKVKTISDYGLTGTYGLRRLYEMIFELRKNQDWK